MNVVINGQSSKLADSTTLEQLICQLDLQPNLVAIEVNQQLVPRKVHSTHQLQEGDEIEVVTLVGGG